MNPLQNRGCYVQNVRHPFLHVRARVGALLSFRYTQYADIIPPTPALQILYLGIEEFRLFFKFFFNFLQRVDLVFRCGYALFSLSDASTAVLNVGLNTFGVEIFFKLLYSFHDV